MSQNFSWIERARKLVEYHQEALYFISRAIKELPISPDDALAVSRLWLEADQMDELICSLLDDMNSGLIGGKGELDVMRGVSLRPSEFEQDVVFYDCSWSLMWDGKRGVSVNLAIEPRSKAYVVSVLALQAKETLRVRFPFDESDLQEALTSIYVAEATSDCPGP